MEEDEVPRSEEGKVPCFLKWVYFLVIVVGLLMFYFFWNGSSPWFDRGAVQVLQERAQTTYPFSKKE